MRGEIVMRYESYEKKIEKKINELVVVKKGFVQTDKKELMYNRVINGIEQYFTMGVHKQYKWIDLHGDYNGAMGWNYYGLCEYYSYQNSEDFEVVLDEIYKRLEEVIFPHYDKCANEFCITRTMVRRVKEETDELVGLYLNEYKRFPEDIEELIRNVRDYYHRYRSEDDEKNKELICVVAAVDYKYLLSKVSDLRVETSLDGITLVDLAKEKYFFDPLTTAFSSFMTDDYDQFKVSGSIMNLIGKYENREWEKEEDWEQVIF